MTAFSDGKNPIKPGFTNAELEFIALHRNDDINQLLLKSKKDPAIDIKKMAAQILARQKAAKKLPEWSANKSLVFPPVLSVEQCSSEATAKYKSTLVSGERLIDITGGMGIDCFYMSHKFQTSEYFEEQKEVAETAALNFGILDAVNIQVHAENSLEALKKWEFNADWIFADPARRGSNQEKVVLLSDCTPDILANLRLLLETAPNILLKTSPLLDIDLAIRQLENVHEVHTIGYEQECKELLFIIKKDCVQSSTVIKSVIISSEGTVKSEIVFTRKEENDAPVRYSEPLHYLYEPHASVLKAGAFKILCTKFNVHKLAGSSHLYTSEHLVREFPGRYFEIRGVCKPDAKEISKFIDGDKANLTIRNFPGKIQDLRKKWRLKEGGDFYLFATTLENTKKVVIVTGKVRV